MRKCAILYDIQTVRKYVGAVGTYTYIKSVRHPNRDSFSQTLYHTYVTTYTSTNGQYTDIGDDWCHFYSHTLEFLIFCQKTILNFWEAPPGEVRFTNSRTIFWIFTNSRTREKWQVSRVQERDFVNSRTTTNKYAGIHEFTNKFFNFHEFTNDISSFHESRTKSFSRIHEQFFLFSRIHERKKADSRYEHSWGASVEVSSIFFFA